MTTVASGRTYDTIHLATSSRASRMLVAAAAGDTIDRTLIPLIHQPGVTDNQGYTAEQRLTGAPLSMSGPPGVTKDADSPVEEPATEERHYIDVQVPGARVPSKILVAPVGHAKPSEEHLERVRAIYDPQVARAAMDRYEGSGAATVTFEPEPEPEPTTAPAVEVPVAETTADPKPRKVPAKKTAAKKRAPAKKAAPKTQKNDTGGEQES